MQILGTSQQPHAGQKADEPEIVIAVQMRNENVIDLAAADLVFGHLHLGTFAAIDKEDLILHGDHLGGRVTIKSRQSRVIA